LPHPLQYIFHVMFFHSPPFIEVGASGMERTSATFLTAKSSETRLTPPSFPMRSRPSARREMSVWDRAPISPVFAAVVFTFVKDSGDGSVTWTRL